MALGKPTVQQIQDMAARYPSVQSAIIPALWAAQHEQGAITDEAMAEIAQLLSLPASLIEATASFYSMFLTKAEGRHDVMICVNSPCMLRGADEIVAYVHQQLGVRDGQTTPDGAITWHSTIECLGACGGAPMMQVDHRFEENLTPERVDAIFERLRTAPAPYPAESSPASPPRYDEIPSDSPVAAPPPAAEVKPPKKARSKKSQN